MKTKVLFIQNDEAERDRVAAALAAEWDVAFAADAAAAESDPPPVVVLDLDLPSPPDRPEAGFRVLAELLRRAPRTKVIVVAARQAKELALRAIGEGAYDYLAAPPDMQELQFVLKRAAYVQRLEREYAELQGRARAPEGFEGMLGRSPQMAQVFEDIRKVAASEAPVLILGESGTGKEMAALAIHRRSARKDGPFVAINCGAIPENLLESELFGHEKGAFTGAHIQRNGQIEVANGGTLLLDEIGELPGALQVKLLRFLQDQRVIRVGGRTEIPVNVRVISATNTDIKRAMERGRFREDLYYRLAVVTMSMPPLRERAGDIAALAEAFLARFTAQSGRKVVGFTPQAARALEAHDWPGNIRELENRIRRAVIMAEGRRVTAADLELGASADGYAGLTLPQARERLEKDLIRRALARHRGKISPAAAELGISRPTLYEMMSALKIQKPKPKRRG